MNDGGGLRYEGNLDCGIDVAVFFFLQFFLDLLYSLYAAVRVCVCATFYRGLRDDVVCRVMLGIFCRMGILSVWAVCVYYSRT